MNVFGPANFRRSSRFGIIVSTSSLTSFTSYSNHFVSCIELPLASHFFMFTKSLLVFSNLQMMNFMLKYTFMQQLCRSGERKNWWGKIVASVLCTRAITQEKQRTEKLMGKSQIYRNFVIIHYLWYNVFTHTHTNVSTYSSLSKSVRGAHSDPSKRGQRLYD